MKRIFNYILSATIVFGLVSCNEDEITDQWLEDNPVPAPVTGDAGTLDLSNYVALGNSLTAGFTDGALYPEGQASSYPSILAKQFALAGGGTFTNPNISAGNGFGGLNSDMSIRGKAFINVPAALENPANAIQFTEGSALTQNTATGINNFGVPGARIVDATNALYGHSAGNPFFTKFASTPGGSSMLDDAVAASPTFFSVWLGSNDVLGYATQGGLDEAMITSQADFQNALIAILGGLSGTGGTPGVIVNIPPVHLAPYFQIVTTLAGGVGLIPMTSQEMQVDPTNAGYQDYNDGLDAAVLLGEIDQAEADIRYVSFALGANAPVITDESLTEADISAAFGAPAGTVVLPKIRQAQVISGISDLFPLTALSVVGTLADPEDPTSVYGVGEPIPDQFTLTVDEQIKVITAYATFNATIEGVVANFPNVTLVDIRPMFADGFGLIPAQAAGLQLGAAAQARADGVLGIQYGGYDLVPLSLDACCLFNSIWSADGIHPNARGAAIVANEIIRALNADKGSNILEADVLSYTGINAEL